MLKTMSAPADPAAPAASASASASASGARALYLGRDGKKQVTCTSEALVVTNARANVWRYPINRLARVVSSTLVDWTGPALSLCMRGGICIAWVNADGEVIGAAHPQLRARISFATALELMVEGPNGQLHYQHWQRARRMSIYAHWVQTQPRALPTQQLEATKRQWVYATQRPNHLPPALRALCLAYVAAQLSRHGLPPVLWGPEAQPINLDEDLCELLWAEMNLCAGNLTDTTSGSQSVTALFESWSARNASTLLLHIHSLQRSARKALTT